MPRYLHDKADVAANTRDGDHCVGKHPDTGNPACGRGNRQAVAAGAGLLCHRAKPGAPAAPTPTTTT